MSEISVEAVINVLINNKLFNKSNSTKPLITQNYSVEPEAKHITTIHLTPDASCSRGLMVE